MIVQGENEIPPAKVEIVGREMRSYLERETGDRIDRILPK